VAITGVEAVTCVGDIQQAPPHGDYLTKKKTKRRRINALTTKLLKAGIKETL
jgi:hypothetical protein